MSTDNDRLEPIAYNGVNAAAKAAGLSRSAFYNEMNAGRVVGRRYGRRVIFEKTEIERFVRSLPTTTAR